MSTPSTTTTCADDWIEQRLRIVRETVQRNRWIPVLPTPPQLEFLCTLEDEVLYGGAAGGGKTIALLASAAQYVDVPGYAAVLFRRTYADLERAESLIPVSRDWWSGTAARYNEQKHLWTFPSGATIQFSHMEIEAAKYDHRSAAYQFVGFDELTLFTRTMYTYMFSRRRKPAGLNVPLRTRAGSNPGGIGHHWVKKRFITECAPGRRFIPAKLFDNPHIDAEQYIAALANLEPIEIEQLKEGNWDVLDSGGVFNVQALAKLRAGLKPGKVGIIQRSSEN